MLETTAADAPSDPSAADAPAVADGPAADEAAAMQPEDGSRCGEVLKLDMQRVIECIHCGNGWLP